MSSSVLYVTRIIESQPNIIYAKVNFTSQLAKVKAKNEMCEQQESSKITLRIRTRKISKAHLIKVVASANIFSYQNIFVKRYGIFSKERISDSPTLICVDYIQRITNIKLLRKIE